MEKQQYLTKNQQIVLNLVEKSTQPLKAHSILFNVQKKGIKAPVQVYRPYCEAVTGMPKYSICAVTLIPV